MNTPQPPLRFRLQQAAVDAHRAEPPPPVVVNKKAAREHREAVRTHYHNALCNALETDTPNRYQRAIFKGLLKRLRGQPSRVKPLFKKETIMPHLREWAEKRGLI